MLWDLNHFKYYFLQLGRVAFHEQRLGGRLQALRRLSARGGPRLLPLPRLPVAQRDAQGRQALLHRLPGRPQGRPAVRHRLPALRRQGRRPLRSARRAPGPLPRSRPSKHARIDKAEFKKFFPAFVLIRIMQAMGAYGLRGFHEKKPLFLQSIPYAIRNIEHVLLTSNLPDRGARAHGRLQRLVGSSALRQFGAAKLKLTVRIQSFSYKNGMPTRRQGPRRRLRLRLPLPSQPRPQVRVPKTRPAGTPTSSPSFRRKSRGRALDALRVRARRPGRARTTAAATSRTSRRLRLHRRPAPLGVLRRAPGQAPARPGRLGQRLAPREEWAETCGDVKAMILAAGVGSRLKPAHRRDPEGADPRRRRAPAGARARPPARTPARTPSSSTPTTTRRRSPISARASRAGTACRSRSRARTTSCSTPAARSRRPRRCCAAASRSSSTTPTS